ncbi:MAG: hypothetical protein J7M38_06665, partial [Armatimonadetes bacterium]|nr:hypothetical protein [Armatimonadota bacterium]
FMREGLERLREGERQRQEYSWMNYGDTYGERYVNWTNQEYDLQWGLLVNYARSGDVAFFDRALEAALHTISIDMINWSNNPDVYGILKEHALWHTGGFDTPRIPDAPYWFDRGTWNTGHVWTQGTYMAYCLTGERRYYESISKLAEFLATSRTRAMERWVHRNYGWMPIAVLGAYHTTGNPYYLNAARFFAQVVIDRQDPGTGALIHPISECRHIPRHMGGKSFMTGIVMAGLTMLDQIEPRDDVERALVLCGDWLWARMWNAERGGFRYAQCPQYDDHAGYGNMVCLGLARAYEISRKPEFREMLLVSMGKQFRERSPATSGKGIAVQMRNSPFAVSALDRWGLDEIPPPPPRAPQVTVPAQIYLVPGRDATLRVNTRYSSSQPLDAVVEVVELPDGLTADQMKIKWRMTREQPGGAEFHISGQAREGAPIRLRWKAGEFGGELTATAHPRRAVAVGEGIGYVGDETDSVGRALRTLGIDIEALPDLTPGTLAGCRALLIGREAHEKNYLNIREHSADLLDFIHSGGRVALIQLQDSSWQEAWLPAPLKLSNTSGRLGAVATPDHPLFTTPHRLEAIAGIISYDTIVEADEAWTVLATDDKGQPSIVEMADGEGRVLVVQPSPDRYVVGEETPGDGLTVETCAQLIENLVAWLNASG